MSKLRRGVASVISALAAAVVVAVLTFAPSSAEARDRRDDADARRTCRSHLMRVGELVFAAARELGPDAPRAEGWYLAALMQLDDKSDATRQVCPADPLAGSRDRTLGYRAMLSYPVRNLESHPLDPASSDPQVLVVCPHHDDGAFVMTDDFDIRFVTRADLGVPASGAIAIGEGATHPALASVRYETRPNEAMLTHLRLVRARTECAHRLSQLGGVWMAESISKSGRPPHSGPALLVYYRQKYYIQLGMERVLICPLDPAATAPRSEADSLAYDRLDLSKSLRKHVSYAVRDFRRFPLDDEATEAQPVMACIHHSGGALVVYSDCTVQFRSREYLGLTPDEPITVGAGSPSKLLLPLIMDPVDKE